MNTAIVNQETVFGFFDNDTDAQEMVRDLKNAGFNESQIGILKRNSTQEEGHTDGFERAAVTGAALGAGTGALWGLGVIAGVLPGIGPAIAGGTLGILLANSVAGAAAVGLTGALMGLGFSEEEAETYQHAINSGKVMVTVKAGNRGDEARALFSRGPY